MIGAVNRGFQRAWYSGAGECGIRPSEMTLEEIGTLQTLINAEIGYILGFADDIFANLREDGGKLTPLIRRAAMWGNRFDAVRARAQVMACGDQKLKWVIHPEKEHCQTCLKLNGRIYRASIWKKYDIYPKHRSLF